MKNAVLLLLIHAVLLFHICRCAQIKMYKLYTISIIIIALTLLNRLQY